MVGSREGVNRYTVRPLVARYMLPVSLTDLMQLARFLFRSALHTAMVVGICVVHAWVSGQKRSRRIVALAGAVNELTMLL